MHARQLGDALAEAGEVGLDLLERVQQAVGVDEVARVRVEHVRERLERAQLGLHAARQRREPLLRLCSVLARTRRASRARTLRTPCRGTPLPRPWSAAP